MKLKLVSKEKGTGWDFMLSTGQSMYVPHWEPLRSLKNLTLLSKVIDVNILVSIAEGKSLIPVLNALTSSDDAELLESALRATLSSSAVEGRRLDNEAVISDICRENLNLISEMLSAVIQTQYQDFFEPGLAKESSPEL